MLFSLTVFVLSYNLETSLGLVGVNPQKLSASYLSSIGECSMCVLLESGGADVGVGSLGEKQDGICASYR